MKNKEKIKNKVENLAKEFAKKNKIKPLFIEIKKQMGYSQCNNAIPIGWVKAGVDRKLFRKKKIPGEKTLEICEFLKKHKKEIDLGVPISKIWRDNQPTSFSLEYIYNIKNNL